MAERRPNGIATVKNISLHVIPRDATGLVLGQIAQSFTEYRAYASYVEGLRQMVTVIDPVTGALVLAEGRVDRHLARAAFLASPLARSCCRVDDMHRGWVGYNLSTRVAGDRTFGVYLSFERERLDGYSLYLADARYGTSWNDWAEEKELARRDANDAWLVEMLGPGQRTQRPGGELTYSFAWGEVWSTYDARSGGSSIGVRFRQ